MIGSPDLFLLPLFRQSTEYTGKMLTYIKHMFKYKLTLEKWHMC